MQPYSQDLRERILRALDRGDRPTEIAQRFEVSRIWVYQVRRRAVQTGTRTSFQIGGHRRSRLAEKETDLRDWIAAEPALTLAQLQQRLLLHGVPIKIGALWHQLNKWDLTFKKNSERKLARVREYPDAEARMEWSTSNDREPAGPQTNAI
jgi:transposase